MRKFWEVVNQVMRQSDVLLIVLDARTYKESMNREIESKIKKSGKKYLYVINKIDLLTKEEQDKIKLHNSIKVSAREHINNMTLMNELTKYSNLFDRRYITVGILGYPNSGKSSLINSLKGQKSAKTSSVSGYTKGLQHIRISPKIMLIDTPGVFSYDERDELKHTLIAAKDINKIKDLDLIAMKIIEIGKEIICEYYDIKPLKNSEDILEELALKLNMLLKGGIPDITRVSKKLIQDYQKGNYSLYES